MFTRILKINSLLNHIIVISFTYLIKFDIKKWKNLTVLSTYVLSMNNINNEKKNVDFVQRDAYDNKELASFLLNY